ncbi:MAG: tripartite tricarboxylate transporter substrate-binding protein [Burkholderiales bacterium]
MAINAWARTPDLRTLAVLFTLCVIPFICGITRAQSLDSRPIRIIVPFAAGSVTDVVLRTVLPSVAQQIGSPVVVDNRAGANGVIGADLVAKSTPDGLTYLMGGAGINAAIPSLVKTLPYDPINDLVPVVRFGMLPFLLLVNTKVPVRNVPQLIEYAKQQPGALAYGTPSSATLVGMETLKRAANIDILGVPYKSSPQAMADLVAGQIQVLIADFPTAMPQVHAGKATVIAVTMAHRSALLPDIPTIGETLPGYDNTAWLGLFAPRGTPAAMMARLSDILTRAIETQDVKKKLAAIGFDADPMPQSAFGPYVVDQIGIWGRLISESGIKPD